MCVRLRVCIRKRERERASERERERATLRPTCVETHIHHEKRTCTHDMCLRPCRRPQTAAQYVAQPAVPAVVGLALRGERAVHHEVPHIRGGTGVGDRHFVAPHRDLLAVHIVPLEVQ